MLLASKRARQLALGTEPLVEWENDKPTVVALREIAENLVNEEMMQAFLAAPLEEEVEFDEDDLVAALHAEVSRELSQTVADPSNPKSQAQQPSPIANNPLFGSGFSSANNAGSAAANAQQSDSANTESTPATNAQESDSANTESSPPTTPPSDPTPEGEQGF